MQSTSTTKLEVTDMAINWPRFDSKILKLEGCWEWCGLLYSNGYGRYHDQRAHRLMWEREFGKIPDGLCACHKCDNRKCVRPSHLFLGTRADNQLDMKIKGRAASGIRNGAVKNPECRPRGMQHGSYTMLKQRTYGTRNGCSKLTDAQILEIRRLRSEGWLLSSLKEKFATSESHISRVCNYKLRKFKAGGELL